MSQWIYAYLFPGPKQELKPVEIFDGFTNFGFEYDSRMITLNVDRDGHCVEDEIQEYRDTTTIRKLLNRGKSLSVTCRNNQLWISCNFAISAANPHIFLGWSSKCLRLLNEVERTAYYTHLRTASKKAQAAYVVFMEEVPDFFEDRFVPLDDIRLIDFSLPSGKLEPIHEIWIDHQIGGVIPQGADFFEGKEIGKSFFQYIPKIF